MNNGTITNEFHLVPDRLETPPRPFPLIPFRRDPDFVNRGDILDQIDRRCLEPAGRVALVGLGGVGKSRLAIEFVHRFAEAHSSTWVFWIHAATQARVEEDFGEIAEAVKLAGRAHPKANIPLLVQDWLSNEGNGKWILVLDSADNPEVLYGVDEGGRDRQPLATYLPQSRNGSIVITARSRDLAFRLTEDYKNIIQICPMIQTDALLLLQKKSGLCSDTSAAKELVQVLDCIPLAICQAAAYIQTRMLRSSVEKYLAEFRKSERKRAKLLEHDAGGMRRDGVASNAVLATWQISFDFIRSQRPSAAHLLSLMSFFDRQDIPEWVLSRSMRTAYTTVQNSSLNEAEESESDATDSDSGSDTSSIFEKDLLMLRDYCLVTVNEEGDKFEMHRLVQISIKIWLKAYGMKEIFEQQYIKRMAASFPNEVYENWRICQDLFAHVQVALDYQPDEDTLEEWATLCYNGGRYAQRLGRYNMAKRMVDEAKRAFEKMWGANNAYTLSSMSMLSSVLLRSGQWEEAERLECR